MPLPRRRLKGVRPGRSRTLQHSQEAGVCVRQAALQRLTGVVDEIGTIRRRDRLGSAVDAELADDVLEVRRDGLRAENEVGGDLLGIVPCGQHGQHFPFSLGQA
jgi:hypothetical protein